jgi:membrane fusion protein, multidrug efflux system
MNLRNIFSGIFVILVIGLLMFWSISLKENKTLETQKKSSVPLVKVVQVKPVTMISDLDLTGTVVPDKTAVLSSQIEGAVKKIFVTEGSSVKPELIVMEIDDKKSVDALVESLLEEFNKEKNNLNRIKELVEKKSLPEEELEKAVTTFKKVEAQLYKAEEQKQYFTIKAPWSGVVSKLLVKEGNIVVPRMQLLEMYEPESLIIRTAVPEKFSVKVKNGLPVKIRLDAYQSKTFNGKIMKVFPYLDENIRTRTVDIKLSESVNLLPGMFARLTIILQKFDNTIVVPVESIIQTKSGPVIFEVVEGKTVKHLVKTGIRKNRKIQIVDGISSGMLIVVEGNENLKQGKPVKIMKQASEQKKNVENE